MSIWIEIMCDVRKDGSTRDGLEPACWTNRNQNTMGAALNKSSLLATVTGIERKAIRIGWIKKNGKWTCPNCAARISQQGLT